MLKRYFVVAVVFFVCSLALASNNTSESRNAEDSTSWNARGYKEFGKEAWEQLKNDKYFWVHVLLVDLASILSFNFVPGSTCSQYAMLMQAALGVCGLLGTAKKVIMDEICYENLAHASNEIMTNLHYFFDACLVTTISLVGDAKTEQVGSLGKWAGVAVGAKATLFMGQYLNYKYKKDPKKFLQQMASTFKQGVRDMGLIVLERILEKLFIGRTV